MAVFIQQFLFPITFTSFCLFFQYVQNNKDSDNDWFRLESNKEGTRWFGKCWCIHELLKYEFELEFDVSIKLILYSLYYIAFYPMND